MTTHKTLLEITLSALKYQEEQLTLETNEYSDILKELTLPRNVLESIYGKLKSAALNGKTFLNMSALYNDIKKHPKSFGYYVVDELNSNYSCHCKFDMISNTITWYDDDSDSEIKLHTRNIDNLTVRINSIDEEIRCFSRMYGIVFDNKTSMDDLLKKIKMIAFKNNVLN